LADLAEGKFESKLLKGSNEFTIESFVSEVSLSFEELRSVSTERSIGDAEDESVVSLINRFLAFGKTWNKHIT
jgi:hypothetical protein